MSSRLSPVAAIQAEAQKAAEELVVDDFVDTYLRERPKTRNPFEPVRVVAPPASSAEPQAARPAPPATPAPDPSEESGIRMAVPYPGRIEVRRPTVEVEAIAVGGAAGEVVALEAELAEREERIESLEQELKRLRDSVSDAAIDALPVVAPPAAPLPPEAPPPAVASPEPVAPAPVAPRFDSHDSPLPVTTPPRRSPRWRSMLGVLLAIGSLGALAVGVARLAADEPASPGDRVEAAAETAPPTAERAAPTEEVRKAPADTGPAASPAATTTATASGGAPSSPSPSPAAPAEPADAPELLSFQGHLTVESAVDAEVVIQGQPAGRTNQRLLTRCGPRNVRLRDGATWITEGEHVRIVCMKHTSIRLEPSGGGR